MTNVSAVEYQHLTNPAIRTKSEPNTRRITSKIPELRLIFVSIFVSIFAPHLNSKFERLRTTSNFETERAKLPLQVVAA
jgi:hypothetical protein